MRVKTACVIAAIALLAAPPASAQNEVPVALWRIDCGEFHLHDDSHMSDTFPRPGAPLELSVGCYLIQHGESYMLWDAGLPGELAGGRYEAPEQTLSLRERIVDQLARRRIRPEQISLLAVSHYHFDHLSQAGDFPNARLLMGAEDLAFIRAQDAEGRERAAIAPWLVGDRPMLEVEGDLDVFGDGRVIMLATPGHTPGHHSLLVRLASGPILLSGDLYITADQAAAHLAPSFNHNRADTLASMDRYDQIVRNLGAVSVIQHEPRHDRLVEPVGH